MMSILKNKNKIYSKVGHMSTSDWFYTFLNIIIIYVAIISDILKYHNDSGSVFSICCTEM